MFSLAGLSVVLLAVGLVVLFVVGLRGCGCVVLSGEALLTVLVPSGTPVGLVIFMVIHPHPPQWLFWTDRFVACSW